MSYCYEGRQLVCDGCNKVGGVRKVRCPFGYCPAPALCAACRKEKAAKLTKEAHRGYGCEKASNNFNARLAEEKALIEAGQYVRCSAMAVDKPGTGERIVHVLFKGKNDTKGFYMAKATYAAFPLGQNVIVEKYATVGTLEPAPASFYG